MLALVETTLNLFGFVVFYIIILSGALSIHLCFTILDSYIFILVIFKTSPYLIGAIKFLNFFVGAILAKDFYTDYNVYT